MAEQITFQIIFQFLQTVGILVGVFYYIMTIRSNQRNQRMQLETRQAQLFLQLYNRYRDDMQDLDIYSTFLDVEIGSTEDFIRLWRTDEEFGKTLASLGGFYEGIGVMVREGYIPVRLVALQWGGVTRRFWEKMEPFMSDVRELQEFPRAWAETEYLYNELMKYIEEHPELKN
jgi:hypothetical protein